MASAAMSTFDIANDQILNGGEVEDTRGQGRLELDDRLSKDDGDGEQQYSVQTALDTIGFKWFQIKLSAVLGLFVIMDSMEMMMLSILGPILTCEWFVPTWQQSLLAMVVMAGQVVSCSFWGAFADRYGRKKAVLLATSMVGYFGLLTSLSPNLAWLIFIRFLVGLAVGSCPQSMTYYSECLPTKAKATCMMVVEVFFSVGAALEVLLAKLVVPRLGWRYLLVFSSFPAILCAILAIRMPESAAFLLAHGRYDEACKVLERMASDNGRSLPPGRLRRDKVDIGKGVSLMSDGLFSKRYRSTVIIFSILGFTGGLMFYGMSLLVPSLLIYADGCHGSDIVRASEESCGVSCHTFTDKDYSDIIINALADLPGIVFMALFFAILGRRSTMSACYFCFTISIAACNFCMTRNYLTFLLTMARAFANGLSQGIFILIAEAFPTEFRALAIGLTITFAKFGGMVSPFIAQVGTAYSPYLSLSVYAVLGVVSTILPAFLPPINPRNSSLESTPIRPKSS